MPCFSQGIYLYRECPWQMCWCSRELCLNDDCCCNTCLVHLLILNTVVRSCHVLMLWNFRFKPSFKIMSYYNVAQFVRGAGYQLEGHIFESRWLITFLWQANVDKNQYFLIFEIHFLIFEIHFLIFDIHFLIFDIHFLIFKIHFPSF